MKPLSEMSDDELKVECAEACGWKRAPEFDWMTHRLGNEINHAAYSNPLGVLVDFEHLPNYPQDLNAMREAVNQLISKNGHYRGIFAGHLRDVIKHDEDLVGECFAYAINATARQRCIAFLQTIRGEKV